MAAFTGPDAEITSRIIAAAIKAHSILGPGLLESTYHSCLAFELRQHGLSVATEISVPIRYPGLDLPQYYKIDLIIETRVIVEVKSVAGLLPVHTAQLRTYLSHSGVQTGLLLNFNSAVLKDGIVRVFNRKAPE